jgi:hypothetical protein
MRKFSFTLFMLAVFVAPSLAQAYESKIEYSKKKQDAFVIDFSYSPEAVEKAIIQRMEKLGYKPKEEKGLFNKDKGFLVFKNAYVTDVSDKSFDYLVKVERKSRKEKDEATLYLVMMKDNNNAKASFESYDVQRAKSFLNNLQPDVEAANLELQITAQEEAVAKAEKKLRDLKDDQVSLEKKLSDNKADQDNTQKDIESKKHELGILVGRRRI